MASTAHAATWSRRAALDDVPAQLRNRGLRWTPQRRMLLDVLASSTGHVTATDVVEQCRRRDPATVPSTVYRTLDVLEELGVVHHCHASDGREEYHVLPSEEHGHFYCEGCDGTWEISAREADSIMRKLRGRGFSVDLSHLTLVGSCATCRSRPNARRA